MKRHEYEGQICGTRFEIIFSSEEDVPNTVKCKSVDCDNEDCVADLSFDWGFMGTASEQTFGIRFFVNPNNGHKIVAGTSYSQPPMGYRVEETRSYRDVVKLENDINQQEKSKSSFMREQMAAVDEKERKQIRDNRLSVNQLQELAAIQAQFRTELVNETIEELKEDYGDVDVRRYTPAIEDPFARARMGVAIEEQVLDNMDKKADSFAAIDPGLHFEQVHNYSPLRAGVKSVARRRPRISKTRD